MVGVQNLCAVGTRGGGDNRGEDKGLGCEKPVYRDGSN